MNELLIPITRNALEINADNYSSSPTNYKAILAIQATGLYVAGDSRFPAANARLKEVAEGSGMPPTMTYRDLVFSPSVAIGEYVPVLSSDPEAAADEGLFYVAHRQIEAQFYSVIDHLIGPDGNPDNSEGRLEAAAATLVALHKSSTAERPDTFRRFFVGLNGYTGPSELYSEAMPILDLLIHGGRNITDGEREEMRINIEKGLYPDRFSRAGLLAQLLEEDDPEAEIPDTTRAALVEQLNAIRRIRKQHQKVVTAIPQGRPLSV